MSMMKEFKEFAVKGNVVDLAVGVIIGAAFGKIVTSFVSDVVMPPLGMAMGKVNFTDLFIDLSGQGFVSLKAAKDAGAPVISYGLFINTIIDFTICLCYFHGHQTDQPFQKRACSGSTKYEGLPLLLYSHTNSCEALSTVHVRTFLNKAVEL